MTDEFRIDQAVMTVVQVQVEIVHRITAVQSLAMMVAVTIVQIAMSHVGISALIIDQVGSLHVTLADHATTVLHDDQ